MPLEALELQLSYNNGKYARSSSGGCEPHLLSLHETWKLNRINVGGVRLPGPGRLDLMSVHHTENEGEGCLLKQIGVKYVLTLGK